MKALSNFKSKKNTYLMKPNKNIFYCLFAHTQKISIKMLYLCICAIVLSCSQTIEIDIPDKGRKMVVNSILYANSPFILSLKQSLYILDENYIYPTIENADVSITINETKTHKINLNKDWMVYMDSSLILASGDKVKITAIHPNFGTCEATTIIPEKPIIDTFFIKYTHRIDRMGEASDAYKCTIKIKDPADTKNYYRLKIYRVVYWDEYSAEMYRSEVEIDSDDPVLSESIGLFETEVTDFFSDALFEGQTYDLSVWIDEWLLSSNQINKFEIILYALSEEYYQYLVTNKAYQNANDNPFAEPVQVYSNITNGLGIFGSQSEALITIYPNDFYAK